LGSISVKVIDFWTPKLRPYQSPIDLKVFG
jgi:hypothetical protein